MVMLSGEVFWLRSITQEDFAVLVAWIDDVLPGKESRELPPKLSDEASQQALDSPMGWSVQAWAALRHVGVTYDRACSLILGASDDEKRRFATVLYRKRPSYKPSGQGADIGEAWWGPQVASLTERGLSVTQIGAMTLDQVDMLFSDGGQNEQPGRLADDDPILIEMDRQAKENLARKEEEECARLLAQAQAEVGDPQ
jgi:hypothetical protein